MPRALNNLPPSELLESIKSRCVMEWCEILKSNCWIWQNSKSNGYGQIRINNKTKRVHKVTLSIKLGRDIIFDAHHICHIKSCCNPAHLEELTRSKHIKIHRRTHCRKGHKYTKENTIVYIKRGKNERICKTCWRKRKVLTSATSINETLVRSVS